MSKNLTSLADPDYYPGQAFKITAAILVANAIILYEEKPKMLVILSNKGFYIASIFSCIIAYGAICFICWISKKLDKHHPWYRNHRKRLFLQILFAVILPVLPLFIAAAIYFNALHIHILETVYMRRYIPMICLFLLALSAYLHYLWAKRSRAKKTPKSLVAKPNKEPNLQLPITKIAYLFAEEKNCYAVDFVGEKISWNLTLEKTMDYLPTDTFFRISRGVILNLAAIAEVKVVDPKKTIIYLLLPEGANAKEPLKEPRTLMPSIRENASFKRQYAKFIQLQQLG